MFKALDVTWYVSIIHIYLRNARKYSYIKHLWRIRNRFYDISVKIKQTFYIILNSLKIFDYEFQVTH